MRPKKHETTEEEDLFRARLDQIIDMKHELAQLAGRLDWDWLDGEIAPLYSDKGRPGIETRFVIGLLLLKHIFALSDEEVCERWVYDPYFQYFTGEEFFQHAFPHERSDLSHWRKRLGEKLELLVAESLRVAHEAGALRTRDLKRVTIDTTVQPKAITFPTDAKLLHAAIQGLNRLARRHGIRLRQSYLRIAKRAAMMAGRYAHAKQFNRHHRQLRLLRIRLGRIIRDIRRKIADLKRLKTVLESMASQCTGGEIPDCPIIDALFDSQAPLRSSRAASGPSRTSVSPRGGGHRGRSGAGLGMDGQGEPGPPRQVPLAVRQGPPPGHGLLLLYLRPRRRARVHQDHLLLPLSGQGLALMEKAA